MDRRQDRAPDRRLSGCSWPAANRRSRRSACSACCCGWRNPAHVRNRAVEARPVRAAAPDVLSCIGLLGIPLGTIISIVILIYIFKPGVKLLFSDKPVESFSPRNRRRRGRDHLVERHDVIVAAAAVLVMVFVIGIVAAIAVPGLLRARMSGNEAVAIGQLRAFTSAETSYAMGNRCSSIARNACCGRPSASPAIGSGVSPGASRREEWLPLRVPSRPGAGGASRRRVAQQPDVLRGDGHAHHEQYRQPAVLCGSNWRGALGAADRGASFGHLVLSGSLGRYPLKVRRADG